MRISSPTAQAGYRGFDNIPVEVFSSYLDSEYSAMRRWERDTKLKGDLEAQQMADLVRSLEKAGYKNLVSLLDEAPAGLREVIESYNAPLRLA